jgi:tetratricopeptide (TPR) repeat protein
MIRFVGRERERAALLAGWERARTGHAVHVLMSGEAGVGKTRLVDELLAHVRQHEPGVRVLRGRCWDVGGAPAYWPWIQAFGFLIDDLGAPTVTPHLFDLDPALARLLPRLRGALSAPADHDEGGSEATQLRLFDSVVLLLRRLGTDRPVLLVLDDLEAADAPSLQLLRFLVRARGGGPLMVVAIYRTPVPPSAPAAAPLWSIGREPGVDVLPIAGLDHDELLALLQAMKGPGDAATAHALHTRTQGNPLFATEFIRLLATGRDAEALLGGAPLPASVHGVIQQRLHTLPAGCRALLAVAAVLGRDLDLTTLARMTAAASPAALVEALGPALDTGVLEAVPERPLQRAFSHPLVRQSLYEELPATTRARLHQQAADTLRERFALALDDQLDGIASHYMAALTIGAAPRALEFCRRAAYRAASLGARDEAVRLLQLALEAVAALEDPELNPQLTCEVLLELGDAQARAGRADDARAALLQVAERAERLGLPTYLARAAFDFGGRFLWARVSRESPELALIERALAALPAEEISLRAQLLARLSGLQRDRRRAPENAERCRQAVALARASGDAEALTQVLNALALHEIGAGTSEGILAAADQLAVAARASGNLERELSAYEFRATARLETGDTAGAEEELALCNQLSERLGQAPQRWFVAVIHTAQVLVRGDLARADELAWAARRLGDRAQTPVARFCHLVQSHSIRREQDRLAELAPLLDEGVAQLPSYALLRCLRCHSWSFPSSFGGRVDEARSYLDRQVANDFADIQDSLHYRFMLALCTEMADHLNHGPAGTALEKLLGEVSHRHLVSPPAASAGSVLRYRGLCAGLRGACAEAARLLGEAEAENRAAGAVIWALRCALDRARFLPVGEAAPLLEAALDETRARRLPALVHETEAQLQARARRDVERHPPAVAELAAAAPPVPLYRREGEFWTIGWSGESLRLRDSKGLRYLGRLLAHAGTDLAALELVAADGAADPDTDEGPLAAGGDLGPVLDATARAAFQARLAALDLGLSEAENWNDRARASRLQEERRVLAQELASAIGLGGRDRRMGDIAERARQSVTKAVKGAIRRIARQHGELGRHLDATIHTGLVCRYEPDPLRPPPWQVVL